MNGTVPPGRSGPPGWASGSNPAAAAQPSGAPAADPEPVALKVLVVDDNDDAAQTLAQLLALEGHAVQTAADGLAALEVARNRPPDVALLDLALPKLDGYALCRTLRAEPSGGRMLIVAVSGWGQDSARQQSSEAGFDAHLVKPVVYRQLLALLRAGRAPPA